MKKKINLAWREIINSNKWKLSKEEFQKALNEDKIKELFKTNSFYLFLADDESGTYGHTFDSPDISESIGKLLSVDLETKTAEIDIFDTVASEINLDEYSLFFIYIGDVENVSHKYNEFKNVKIIYPMLQKTVLSAYDVALRKKGE